MARPMKNGLDYFPFDVDFFTDKKIRRLRAAYGNDGVSVYIYLLCSIYRNGCYAEYDEDLLLDICDELHISSNSIKQIMNYLFSRSLLILIESKLAAPVKVITAASVQRRFQAAKKGAKREICVEAEFWVLSDCETESFIKLYPEEHNSGKNDDNSRKNESENENIPAKESKEKESIVKENKAEHPAAPQPSLDELIYDYGQDAVNEYSQKVRNWYASKGIPLTDLQSALRKWLEKDGVPLIDHSMDKYTEILMNNF